MNLVIYHGHQAMNFSKILHGCWFVSEKPKSRKKAEKLFCFLVFGLWRGGAKFQIQIFCPWRMSQFKLEPSKPNLGCSHLSLQFQKQKRWKNPFGFSGFSVFWVPHSQIPFALARSTQAPRRARQSWHHRNFENRTDAAKPNGSVARHDNDDELAKVAANETCNRRVTYI